MPNPPEFVEGHTYLRRWADNGSLEIAILNEVERGKHWFSSETIWGPLDYEEHDRVIHLLAVLRRITQKIEQLEIERARALDEMDTIGDMIASGA